MTVTRRHKVLPVAPAATGMDQRPQMATQLRQAVPTGVGNDRRLSGTPAKPPRHPEARSHCVMVNS